MRSLDDLARAAAETSAWARREPGVGEVEVFAASNASLLARLNYTSHIPCNGVEEPKSTESFGLGVRASFDTEAGRAVGFGSRQISRSPAAGARSRRRDGAQSWIPTSSRCRGPRASTGRWTDTMTRA